MDHPDPLVIGIAGGSGSGKTTVAQEILNRVGADRIAFLAARLLLQRLKRASPRTAN